MKVLEHLTEEDIERYRARASSSAETLATQQHVGVCGECRTRLERAVDANAAFLNLREQLVGAPFDLASEPTHLAYELLALYVDDQLDEVEREIADSHMAICHQCADDIADLRQYQTIAADSTLTAMPERGATSSDKSAAWWQRLFALDSFPSFGALVPAGMAAAVVVLLVLGVWLATRTNMRSDNEVAQVGSANRGNTTTPQVEPKSSNDVSNSTEIHNPSNVQSTPTPVTNATPRTSQAPQNGKPRTPATNNSSPTVTLNDGGTEVAFDSEGNSNNLESLPVSIRQAVRRSISSQQAQTPRALDALAEGRAGILMSGSAEITNKGVPFALLSPIGKITREAQPILRWRPLAEAKSYTVAIVDSNFRVVAQSPSLTATEWKPTQPLPRGLTYSWQVTALKSDGTEVVSPVSPAPQAKFRVMDENALDEVTRMEKSGVKSHLARGVIYAQAGLLDEAGTEFEALVQDNPRSQLARRLLNSVKK